MSLIGLLLVILLVILIFGAIGHGTGRVDVVYPGGLFGLLLIILLVLLILGYR